MSTYSLPATKPRLVSERSRITHCGEPTVLAASNKSIVEPDERDLYMPCAMYTAVRL